MSRRKTGVAAGRAKTGGVVKLTPAEADVVSHVSRGQSNREIAAALGKSVTTVKAQLHSVFRKLGVVNRLQLIVMFRE